jgi:hypothetical protein
MSHWKLKVSGGHSNGSFPILKVGWPSAVILTYTVVQIVILLVFGPTPYPDSTGYFGLAKDCIEKGDWYPAVVGLNKLAFIWNTGTVNAVVFSLRLFGSVVPLLVVYSLIQGASAWLIYEIVRSLFSERTARIVLLLFVVYPANYGQGTSLLSECPFIFFSLLSFYFALCRRHWILAGCLLALANWFRPMGLVMLLPLVGYILYRRPRCFYRPVAGYLLGVCFIGGMAWWRTGHFIAQAQTGWMSLLTYSVDNNKDSEDDWLPHVLQPSDTIGNKEWRTASLDALPVYQKDRVWRQRWMSWLKDHPSDYLKQMPVKLVDTYATDNVNLCVFLPHKQDRSYLYEELSMRTIVHDRFHWTPVQWITLVNLAYFYFLLLSAVVGTWILFRCRLCPSAIIPLGVIFVGTTVLLLFGHGEARFHQPFMPFIMMLSAQAFAVVSYRKHHSAQMI